jgi:hypothetical protein
VALAYVEPGCVEARPAPRPAAPRPAWRRWPLAPLVLVLVAAAVSAFSLVGPLASGAVAGRLTAQCRFNEDTWVGAWAFHTLVTHAFLHTSAAELAYFAGGLLLFGWLVQRNIGFLRTVLLFAFCAAFSAGFWQFAKTEIGQDLIYRYAGKLFEALRDRVGFEAGFTAAAAYGEAWNHMLALRGEVWGAAGALAGFMTFALCRRRFRAGPVGVKWLVLLLAVGYLALGGLVWVHGLGRDLGEVPFVLWVGGALGGLFFIIPDKFLHEALDAAGDKVREKVSESLEQG